jgi:hypothetical protein
MASGSPTFKAGPLITLTNPRRWSRWKATRSDRTAKLRTTIRHPNWLTSCCYRWLRALRKLRIPVPCGRFTLDGGTALAFLAQ